MNDADRLQGARDTVATWTMVQLVTQFREWCQASTSDRSIAYVSAIETELMRRILILQNIASSVGLSP